MPTASAPSVWKARISAGGSEVGPPDAGETASPSSETTSRGGAPDARLGKAGELGVGDGGGALDGVGHGTQPRAEHYAHARTQAGTVDEHLGGLAPAHGDDVSSNWNASGSSSPIVVVSDRPR